MGSDRVHLEIGSPDLAVLEAEVEQPVDPAWVFGHFRLRVAGHSVGDWDDVATLRAIGSWWASFSSQQLDRWDPAFAGMTAEQLFHVVSEAAYGEGDALTRTDADIEQGSRLRNAHDISHLGMSAWVDAYRVLLFEPPGEQQRLIWQAFDAGEPVREARLPANTLQTLGGQLASRLQELEQQ